MTGDAPTTPAAPATHAAVAAAGGDRPERAAVPGRYRSWIPGWGLITTKHLELRKRRALMAVTALLIVGLPVLVLGIRLAVPPGRREKLRAGRQPVGVPVPVPADG